MSTPAECYRASPRPYRGLPELTYPLHDRDVLVTACGRICMHRKRVNISYPSGEVILNLAARRRSLVSA